MPVEPDQKKRRTAERDRGEDRRQGVACDRMRRGVRDGEVQEDGRDQRGVVENDQLNLPGQHRCPHRDERRQRVCDEAGADRREQVRRPENRLAAGERGAHPPEVPDHGQVVARVPAEHGHRQELRQGPGEQRGEDAEQSQGRAVRGCRSQSNTLVGVILLYGQDQIPPMHRYFTSRNSSKPYFEPSRPIPDSFIPPKGATSVEIKPVLTPMMPNSSASATRQTRPMSRP